MRAARIIHRFSELAFPRRCALCRAQLLDGEIYDACVACMGAISAYTGHSCTVCAMPMDGELAGAGVIKCGRCRVKKPPFDKTVFCLRYENEVRELLHLFKFSGREGLVGLFAPLMSSRLYRETKTDKTDFVVPVPLHHRRLLKRGFNQAYLLARAVADDLKLTIKSGALIRIKNTKAQFERSRSERFKNIKGAFSVRNGAFLKGKTVLLVDDIMTSGATLHEAARTIKKAGAKKVFCLVAARA